MTQIKKNKNLSSHNLEARIDFGRCPCCETLTPFLFLQKEFYRCATCGEEVKQFVNGVIKYMPVTQNEKTFLMKTDV